LKKMVMRIFSVFLFAGLLLVSCNANKATTKTVPEQASANKALEETYWMLTELEGKPVTAQKEGEKPSYIYFSAGKKRVAVSGGCNVMGGSYELLEGNRIVFGQMMSTMMACPDMTIEEGLKKMTGMADNYAIQGDNLSFAKARMAPIARFKAIPAPDGFKFD
jgi:heat shock protein HslJ